MSNETNLIWVDVETTGLDPIDDELLEMAIVVTTHDLEEIEALSLVYGHPNVRDLKMTPEVRAFHEKNGLLEECSNLEEDADDVTRYFIELIQRHTVKGASPLCGSTVEFDKAWLGVHAPSIVEWCHYRTINVSSIKELTRRWDLPQYPSPVEKPHRALPDVRASIAELRFYREHVFMTAKQSLAVEDAVSLTSLRVTVQTATADRAAATTVSQAACCLRSRARSEATGRHRDRVR